MAQRSELFSIKNILLLGLVVTVTYGLYSYNVLRNRLTVSHANFLTLKSEYTQGTSHVKAVMKSKLSCLKDLKQMRTSMWELRSKMSDLETENNQQKHQMEERLVSLKKEGDSCKMHYESLQKEIVKLKEDDRVRFAKTREDEIESEKKTRKLNAEHNLALSKLRDQLQDMKTENNRLKEALAVAKTRIDKSEDSAPKPKPKHSPNEDPPRQMLPPKKSSSDTIAVNTTSSKLEAKEVVASSMTKRSTATVKKDNLSLERDGSVKKPVPSLEGDTNVKKTEESEKDGNVENDKIGLGKSIDESSKESKGTEAKNAKSVDKDESNEKENLKSGAAQQQVEQNAGSKFLQTEDQKNEKEGDKSMIVGGSKKEKVGVNTLEKEPFKRFKFQAALEKMKHAKAAAASKEDNLPQVDMPLPRDAARRNKEPNQLPQPVQPVAAAEVDKDKEKSQVKPRGAAADDDDHLL